MSIDNTRLELPAYYKHWRDAYSQLLPDKCKTVFTKSQTHFRHQVDKSIRSSINTALKRFCFKDTKCKLGTLDGALSIQQQKAKLNDVM